MQRVIATSALMVAMGTMALSVAASAQRLEFVPVNRTGRIVGLSNQAAAYAAPNRAALSRTEFAIVTVSGGLRAMPTTPQSTLSTVNAAEAAPTTTVRSSSRVDTVGLEALPEAHTPLMVLARELPVGADLNLAFPLAVPPRDGYAISPAGNLQAFPELGCDRLGNNCGIVYTTPNGVFAMRFPLAMGISPVATAFGLELNSLPDRYDIAYDDVGAVITAQQNAPAEVRMRSLARSLDPNVPAVRINDGLSNATFPRIACAVAPPGGFGVGCMTVMATNGLLQSKLSRAGTIEAERVVYDGTGRSTMLIRESSYDIAVGPIGYRVAFFAFAGVILKLRVVDISADGTYMGAVEDFPAGGGPSTPRSVRIAAALNPDYSLVTWLAGTGIDSVSSGMIVRPVPPRDAGMEGGVEAGLEPGPEAGIETRTEAGMEGGVPMPDGGWDRDAHVVPFEEPREQDTGGPGTPPTRAPAYYGGACQCRSAPTSPAQSTRPSSPSFPFVCMTLVVALVIRKRKSS